MLSCLHSVHPRWSLLLTESAQHSSLSCKAFPELCVRLSSSPPSGFYLKQYLLEGSSLNTVSKTAQNQDFPGGPRAKTLNSQCREPGFDPWLGNQISHAATKSLHAATKAKTNTYPVPVCVFSYSVVSNSATLQTVDRQVPLSMEFSRQEYCGGLPFPISGDFSPPRDRTQVSCISCIGRRCLYCCATWKAPILSLAPC